MASAGDYQLEPYLSALDPQQLRFRNVRNCARKLLNNGVPADSLGILTMIRNLPETERRELSLLLGGTGDKQETESTKPLIPLAGIDVGG